MLRHLYLYNKFTLSHGFNILFFSDNNAIKFHYSGFVMPSLWVRYASAPNLPQTYPLNGKNGALRQEAYRCLPPSGDDELMTVYATPKSKA